MESLPPVSPDLLSIPAIQLEVKDIQPTMPTILEPLELNSCKLPLRPTPKLKVIYNLMLVTSVPATTTNVVQYETQNVQPITVSQVQKVDTAVVNNEVIE